MLHVTRDAGVGQAVLVREPPGQIDGCADASGYGLEPFLDRGEQLTDLRLGRIGPRRFGNQVDFSAVEPVGNDPDFDAVGVAKLCLHRFGGAVERGVLLRGRLAAVQQLELPRGVVGVHLRPAVDHQIEAAASLDGEQRRNLARHVVGVGAGDDDQSDAGHQQLFHRVGEFGGAVGARRHCRAVPVECDQAKRGLKNVGCHAGSSRGSVDEGG